MYLQYSVVAAVAMVAIEMTTVVVEFVVAVVVLVPVPVAVVRSGTVIYVAWMWLIEMLLVFVIVAGFVRFYLLTLHLQVYMVLSIHYKALCAILDRRICPFENISNTYSYIYLSTDVFVSSICLSVDLFT